MKEVAMDRIQPFLPQEIIRDILKLLPVKSLIRFQCVCKHCKNLIKSPFFIAEHLHHSIQHRACLLFQHYDVGNCLQLYLLHCDMELVEVRNIPIVPGLVQIVGSCNGLLCLRLDGNHKSPPSLLLLNPASREVRQVPTTFPDFDGDCCIGFGFSPIINDYKIVRLYVSRSDYLVHLVEVYSLGSGSWKKIEVGNSGLTFWAMNGARVIADLTINGAIFWFGCKKATGLPLDLDLDPDPEYVILSFDIAREVFELIPVPALDLIGRTHVIEFEHRLALLCTTPARNSYSHFIELWVLEEATGGSEERWRWTKKYNSILSPCLLCSRTIWRNGNARMCHLLRGDEDPEFVAWTVMANFTSTELKVLFDNCHFIFNYVESLVPVSNIRIEES